MDKQIIHSKMAEAIEQKVFPGAVLLCAMGKDVIYHHAFGHCDIFNRKKAVKASIFDLASLTKPLVTAACVSKLVEQNGLRLDHYVSEILPEFNNSEKRELTIDMCLRHTTGLPPYKEYFRILAKYPGDRKEKLYELILKEPLVNPPGTVQDYSDIGFMILGRVVEKICGRSIDKYVQETIYAPLSIKHLFYIPRQSRAEIIEQFGELIAATQDCPWRNRLMFAETDDDNTWSVGGVDAHAGLFGDAVSIHSMCVEFLNAVTGHPTQTIPSDILQMMVHHKDGHDMVAGFDTPSKEKSSAGKYFSGASIGHLGFTGTSFWIDPQTSLIVVLLTNRVHPSRQNETIKQFRPEIHNLIYEQIFR